MTGFPVALRLSGHSPRLISPSLFAISGTRDEMTCHQTDARVETIAAPCSAGGTVHRPCFSRFRRSQSGATAVEFGFVAMPFLMLLAAIVETALMLWTSQVLEEAVSETSRSLLTGESRNIYTGTGSGGAAANTAAFKTNLCKNAPALVDCDKLTIDVRTYTSFNNAKSGTDSASPISSGALNTKGFGYNQPGAEQIVVVRAILEYPLFFTQWSSALTNIGAGKRAIVASTTFRAEPFS
jgi:Flp pilus assembly protein TadG